MERKQRVKVETYSTPYCPYCQAAKQLLQRLEIDYEDHDLSDVPDRREVTNAILNGHRTVPLIVIDGEPVGGFSALEAMHERGELEARVFDAAAEG